GSRTSPSGSIPIRPAPRTVKPTWCATSHKTAVVRSTPARPVPMPTCGAVIQPIQVIVVSTARPLGAAAQAAIPPVTTSGRAARAPRPEPDPEPEPEPACCGAAGDCG